MLDEGSNLITDLSPTDLTPLGTIPVGNTPIWETVRPDSQRLYVVTQGDGRLYTINTATNTVLSAQAVGGPGANFVLYDKIHNRLFVTNPNSGAVYVFDATTDPPHSDRHTQHRRPTHSQERDALCHLHLRI